MADERKIVCYIAESLDGYIATEDDSLDWLFKVEGEGDAGYAEFMETIDTVVMGRRTYDWVMDMEKGEYPYEGLKSYIYSRSVSDKSVGGDIEFIDMDIPAFADMLKSTPGKNIWIIGGSELLAGFMDAGLIDEFIISIAPVVIGRGIPLFQKSDLMTEYRLKEVKRYGEFAQLHYISK
ncbi:dihydrofolate reductase family protein [Planomicrobium okeanokoites]|uniref:Dihydrofolate reductase family protein n=1 Tax=Planomicrobium okeanokoites TaxID=244 RepID=A0ABV7KJM1_PLAOK|nr:dihydrofolate reductase family protein [Planomicrobium okeanokoites]TAA68991.1 dihydrofolate reductase [Planomicrobium okeanokoites]